MDMLGLRNHIKRKFSSLRVSQICEILSLALAFPSYSHTFRVSSYLIEDVKVDYVAEQEDEDEVDYEEEGEVEVNVAEELVNVKALPSVLHSHLESN